MFPEEVEYYIAESNGVQVDGDDIVLDDSVEVTEIAMDIGSVPEGIWSALPI